ncbi:MAG: hypothetical protein V1944_02560, partial [Candidatus Aenigmatarchaeota archaeon]
ARGLCNEDDGDWCNDKCAVEVGSGDLFGNGYDGGTDGHSNHKWGKDDDPCAQSWWPENGAGFITPTNCQLAVFDGNSFDRDAVNEIFEGSVSFDDILQHTNNLTFGAANDKLIATHAHNVAPLGTSVCDYTVHVRACDCSGGCNDECNGCTMHGGDAEVMIEYSAKYVNGTDVIPPFKDCWDQ